MTVSILEFRNLFPSLTAHVDDSTINALVSVVGECIYSEGDIVIKDNTFSDKLFFLLNGSLSSFIERNGEKIKLGEMKPGDMAGEVSLFGNCPTTATVIAKTDCKLLTLNKANLDHLQIVIPEFVSQLLRTVSDTMANRLLTSDELLYQCFTCEEKQDEEVDGTQSLIACYTTIYKYMHGHQEIKNEI